MTALATRLAAFVRAHGPLDVGRFMALCAAARGDGYYAGEPAIGPEGDFVTAPEVSQIFGELIGLACIAHWRAAGSPAAFRIAEVGPGNGTLMSDLWRALAVDPDCRAAVRSVELVETSDVLRARQRARLAGLPLSFHDRLEALPEDLPLFLVANEFFDALPVRQFVRTAGGWRERLVSLDTAGRLAFALHPRELPGGALADPRFSTLGQGAVVEVAPAREALAAVLARKILDAGGLALVIDYGYDEEPAGDTLQAVQRHHRVGALERPGEADISAHVDFRALARAMRSEGAVVFGPLTQRTFLDRLGIAVRLERLCRGASPEIARRLRAGVDRLVSPDGMGELFRVIALVPSGAPVPPGFLEEERPG